MSKRKQRTKTLLEKMLDENAILNCELNDISRTVVDMMLYDFGHSKKEEKQEIEYLIGQYKTIQTTQWKRDIRMHEMSKAHTS
jgi:Zn-finger domain-containing protein